MQQARVPCMQCGRVVAYPLVPCAFPGSVDLVWVCLDCGCPPGAEPVSLPYVHPRFRPGLNVFIDPCIREVHPLSPAAGRVVKTCEGSYYPLLEAFGYRHHTLLVPVVVDRSEQVWYIEEEYVCID